MSTDLDGSRIQDILPHDEDEYSGPETFSASLPRQNLAGGTGVFANFFEEMADPQPSDSAARRPVQPNSTPFAPTDRTVPNDYHTNPPIVLDYTNPMHAFLGGFTEDDDLHVLDQYRGFVNQSQTSSIPVDHYYLPASTVEPSSWAANPATSGLQPLGGAVTDYFHGELDNSTMCISYTPRYKPPKILAKRFLLGETIGRGSYGKVKDAIDLVTFRRHAVKIINKFGVRKIPGGWSQALSEAALMRRLPPNRHIVSLVAVLRLDNPDRLCMVMEHCLGSVHDLQAAGVPMVSTSLGDDQLDDCEYESKCGEPGNPAELKAKKSRRFPVPFPSIATDIKLDTKRRLTDAFKRRKVSNIEPATSRKHPSMCHNQQQQQQFRRLSEAQAHAYFLQLIDGLYFLHRNGVIHRDIKPANLLLTPAPGCGLSTRHSLADTMDAPDTCFLGRPTGSGQPGFLGLTLAELLKASRGWLVKLTDFGVSASLSVFSESEQVTGGQTTPAVQPPEVAKGVQTMFLGPQLDVYSAGVTLYFMLTGRVPFSCQNVLQIFEAIADGEYVIPGHVSTHAAHLVRKMMHKDPKKRFNLSQVRDHPWIVSSPPAPLTLAAIQNRCRTQSFDSAAANRGYVFWLDPLDILRRPGCDYPYPHIDDTGARYLSPGVLVTDSNTPPDVVAEQDAQSLGSDSTDSTIAGVAPLSVLNALKVYHAMSQPTAQSALLAPGTASNQLWTLEDRLAQLGIESGYGHHPAYNHPPYPQSGLGTQSHHPSGESDRAGIPPVSNDGEPSIQPSCSNAVAASCCEYRTASGYGANFVPGIDYPEPPPCPADIPVAEPACLSSPAQVTFAVAPGGLIRTASFHTFTVDDPSHGSSGNLGSNNNQCTWHAGFRPGTKKADLGDFRFSPPRAQTVPSGLAKEHEFVDEPRSGQPTQPGSTNSLSRIHRRLSHWWSSSIGSLRKRFRRRPDSLMDDTVSLQANDRSAATAPRDRPLSSSAHQSSKSVASDGANPWRSRRWFISHRSAGSRTKPTDRHHAMPPRKNTHV